MTDLTPYKVHIAQKFNETGQAIVCIKIAQIDGSNNIHISTYEHAGPVPTQPKELLLKQKRIFPPTIKT